MEGGGIVARGLHSDMSPRVDMYARLEIVPGVRPSMSTDDRCDINAHVQGGCYVQDCRNRFSTCRRIMKIATEGPSCKAMGPVQGLRSAPDH